MKPEKDSWASAVQWARALSGKYFYKDILLLDPVSENGHVVLGERSSHPDFSGVLDDPGHLLRRELRGHLSALMPWRKGPFRIMGETLKASWTSDRKYQRVMNHLRKAGFTAEGAAVADVGCNNGYYMFRLLEEKPQWVLGMDPVPVMHRQFQFLHSFYPSPVLEFVRSGFRHLDDYSDQFDLILNMGIIYHHTDPVEILRLCKKALKPGGILYLESMGYRAPDGSMNSILFPSGKYAGANGIWFLPTAEAMEAMLQRSGFREIQLHEIHDYTGEHQDTPWSQSPGLGFFMTTDDSGRPVTTEGYPEPVRIHMTAKG